jgi:hypothetical protein
MKLHLDERDIRRAILTYLEVVEKIQVDFSNIAVFIDYSGVTKIVAEVHLGEDDET